MASLKIASLVVLSQLAGCALMHDTWDFGDTGFDSTYRKFLARAERGDAEAQNAVGYMLYQGEGVERDRILAQIWFARAAERGNSRARRNLAFLAAQNADATLPGDPGTERRPAETAERGEAAYLKFCGGCHGTNGVSAYENSPSFAFGERLEKGDAALMRGLLDGRQEMPGWEGKLPVHELREILAFVRTLPARYDSGIGEPLRAAPGYYYLFGPMEARRRAAQGLPM